MLCFLIASPVTAAAPIGNPEPVQAVSSLTSPASITAYIQSEAEALGVNPTLAVYVASHEDPWFDPKKVGDLNIICGYGVNKGKPYTSRGQFQISECGHPEVSTACAFNIRCATPIALALMKDKKTCVKQFSTCAYYYGVEKHPPEEQYASKDI